MKKRLTMLLCAIMVAVTAAVAQTKVSGVVIQAEDGEPVIGAHVVCKDAKVGTVTDVNGRFQIEVPVGATLNITYVGNLPVFVKAKQSMRVMMESEKQLDEVMVVAYGTTTKAQFTGSAKVMDSKDIEAVQTSNALNALTGHVAGVEVINITGDPAANSPTIRMRGITSINAGTSPLIILDGTPYPGDMNTINNADIESMTVLKDAAANALYGARGANGVIVITTKRGKVGAGAKVTLDAKWGSNSRALRTYETVNAAQYYETYYQALKNYAINEQGMNAASAHNYANQNLIAGSSGLGYNIYQVPAGQSLIGTNGRLNPNAVEGNIVNYNGVDYMLRSDDWMDAIHTNGLRQEYNVNVSNATEKGNFMASFGYLDNNGIINNSNFTRFNGRLKAELQAKDWLRVGANMSYTHYSSETGTGENGSSSSSANIFAIASQAAPIYPLYLRDVNGQIMKDANGYTMYDYGGKNGPWMGLDRPFLANANAASDNELNAKNLEGNAATATGFAEIRFLKDFKLSSTNTITLDEARSTDYTNPYYGSYASDNGSLVKSHDRSFSYAFQQLLTWGHTYGKHEVDVMLGHESYRAKDYSLYARSHQMFDPTNHELAGAVINDNHGSSTSDYNNEGIFGRAQYNFAQKYFVSGSYRRDASSRFHPDNRWGNFYSVGAAWVMSEESWLKNVQWIDFLKLKASYGEQGNDNIGSYLYTNTYNIVNSNGSPAAKPAAMGNKDITWEKNGNLNVGVEFDLFKGRLTGGVEYFWRKTSDMLFSFPLPDSYGFTKYWANIGDMMNQGIEVDLTGEIIRTKDVNWSIGANLTHYKNEVTYLADEHKTVTTADGYKGYTANPFFVGEGLSLYSYYMKEYAGIYTEDTYHLTGATTYDPSLAGHAMWYKDVLDTNGNRTGERETTTDYNAANEYLTGDKRIPVVYGGFHTNLTFHGFDFTADFAYSLGGKVYDYDYAGFMANPTASSKGQNIHKDMLNAWTLENSGSDIPRNQFGATEYANSQSTRFLTSANYLSLQNLSLGYTFPAKMTQKAKIDRIRLYVNCNNVWLWSARRGLDPRVAMTGWDSNSMYSTMRTISAGVNVTF